jgi:glycosyltransferase involved in cell wall biosynthesis
MSTSRFPPEKPSVSIITPTLNSAKTLRECFAAIKAQDYPSDLVEIVVADGGSSDDTVAIARSFGATVVANPRKTGEAGKAVALRSARNELVAFIDSDNILEGSSWLRDMVAPFSDPQIEGAEPLRFVSRDDDTLIDRYCAVMGVNDPLCLFIGNFDKLSALTGTWTKQPLHVENRSGYAVFRLAEERLPTIGANGTLYRRETISPLVGTYFMDIDVPYAIAAVKPNALFAKVQAGIRHLYCANSRAFMRKQKRRVRDFFTRDGDHPQRRYPWTALARSGAVKFGASCITVVPLLYQTLVAYRRSRNRAAFFHPIACWLTFWVYGVNVVFARGKAMSRANWQR